MFSRVHPDDVTHVIIKAIEKVALPKFGRCAANEIAAKNTKDWDDPVTTVDNALQDRLGHDLGYVLGPVGVVGEEQGSYYGKLRTDKPVIETVQAKLYYYRKGIVIDPMDGTKRFRQGKHGWAVMLALFEQGQYSGAWIVMPKIEGDKASYDVVSTILKENHSWMSAYSHWHQGKRSPQQMRSLGDGPYESKKIIIQGSAFAPEYQDKLDVLCNILELHGYCPIIARDSLSGKDFGSAGLDWSALARNQIAGLLISSAPFYDEIPGALLAQATGKQVTTLRGDPYMKPGLELPDMNWGVMAGNDDAQYALLNACREAFGDLFASSRTCTLPRRLLPSVRGEALTP